VTLRLGTIERFALELGKQHRGLRRVDVWAAGQWLTCDDNVAYAAQLQQSMRRDLARLGSLNDSPFPFPCLSPAAGHRQLLADEGELREGWQFLEWGPTTDNVLAHLLPDGNHLAITVSFWREEHLRRHPEHAGAVFVTEIAAEELAGILQGAIAALVRGLAPAEPDVAE
jgi:hypothetical protein